MNETLAQDVGRLDGKFDSLEKSVERLTDKVELLTAVLNQARGAKLALFAIPAIVSVLTALFAFFSLNAVFPRVH